MTIRTRYAPSPTGYSHLGNIRTALFAWAYARHHDGKFILRIEDTDQERSTDAAVKVILDAMSWLELDYDEGPFYQMQRMPLYKAAVARLMDEGKAYHCYTSIEELDALREAQTARGEKPRYDGRWRPEPGKTLPTLPSDIQPVVRFRNPVDGAVVWDDQVKGRIEISNAELDDLVIARPDGTPTYNFCVVVDDIDMAITHVIRGDDHVNNTPRQINLYHAMDKPPPVFAHTPTVLGPDGSKLSKRHGAKSVMEYRDEGYLPEAMINMLARLGWSHGDEEVFSREQLVHWFDANKISASASRFDAEKLLWLNHEHIKRAAGDALAAQLVPFLQKNGFALDGGPDVSRVADLLRDRAATLVDMAIGARYFYVRPVFDEVLFKEHTNDANKPALVELAASLTSITWSKSDINAAIKASIAKHGLKMPQLMMPLRVLLTGQTQTPAIDAIMDVLGREEVLVRLKQAVVT
ncbi:MAG: glutamate--tRNA ligase [Burkholderiales bacterium]|nr:glutamate--tRNA ligase [Burkholderiales bacterium]